MSDVELTLTEPAESYSFIVGVPLVMTSSGALRPATWRERLRQRLRRLLWWRDCRVETTAVDHKTGTITVVGLRWSWWRWKWVRQEQPSTPSP